MASISRLHLVNCSVYPVELMKTIEVLLTRIVFIRKQQLQSWLCRYNHFIIAESNQFLCSNECYWNLHLTFTRFDTNTSLSQI